MTIQSFRISLFFLLVLVFSSCQKSKYTATLKTENSTNAVSISPDTAVQNFIVPYKKQLDSAMNKVIGYAETDLTKGQYQSTLGNFVIDAVYERAKVYSETPVDFGFVTSGGLRTQIAQGNVTVGNIYELMPFDNELVIQTIKGSTVLKLLDYTLIKGNTQFSNLSYEINSGKIQNIRIANQTLDSAKTYTMAVSDYLANGGDGLFFLSKEPYTLTGKSFRTAIIEQIEFLASENLNISGPLDNRVIIIKNE